MLTKKPPFFGRVFHRFASHVAECTDNATEYCGHDDLPADGEADADLVSSKLSRPLWRDQNLHAPVIDIDLPCRLVESSSGHHHLYIDFPVSWEKYLAMLKAMADAGIVQPGYVAAAERRGYTSVRHPEKLKPQSPLDAPF